MDRGSAFGRPTARTSQVRAGADPFSAPGVCLYGRKRAVGGAPVLGRSTASGVAVDPPGVKIERDCRPLWLGDYSFNPINAETLPICDFSAMQYGRCLDRLLREIVYADPKLGLVHMIKADVSNSFYRMGLRPSDAA